MPIIDYHCHLPPDQIADNKQFDNLTQIWLYGDHYKWRVMRTNGVDKSFCTGISLILPSSSGGPKLLPPRIGRRRRFKSDLGGYALVWTQ